MAETITTNTVFFPAGRGFGREVTLTAASTGIDVYFCTTQGTGSSYLPNMFYLFMAPLGTGHGADEGWGWTLGVSADIILLSQTASYSDSYTSWSYTPAPAYGARCYKFSYRDSRGLLYRSYRSKLPGRWGVIATMETLASNDRTLSIPMPYYANLTDGSGDFVGVLGYCGSTETWPYDVGYYVRHNMEDAGGKLPAIIIL